MRYRSLLVVALLVGLSLCATNPSPSPAETWVLNEMEYGTLPGLQQGQMTELIFTENGPYGLFEFAINDDNRVSSAAIVVNNVRVIALSHPGFFDRSGSSDELLTSFLRWTSYEEPSDIAPLVSDLSKKIVVCTEELKTLYEELGATNVHFVNFLEGSDVVYAPLDTDVLVMDYSVAGVWSNPQLERVYETSQEYLDRDTGGLIVGGESSYYKWIWYGDCSAYPGNQLLNSYGVHFACRWWGTRGASSALTMDYIEQSLFHTLDYVKTITETRTLLDSDVISGTVMSTVRFSESLSTLANGCAACDNGQDTLAPVSALVDTVYSLVDEIVLSGNCDGSLPLTPTTYASYFCIDLAHRRSLIVDTADIIPIPTSDEFPGMNVVIEASDMVNVSVDIDTDRCFLQSIGLYALPGEPITVTVPQEWVNLIEMAVGIWRTDVRHKNPARRNANALYREYTITTETFTFASGHGGPLYVNIPCGIFQDNFDSRLTGTIDVENVVSAVHYRLGETTEAQWNAMLANDIAPWVEIETNDSVYSVPKTDVVGHSYEDITIVAEYWQRIIDLYAAFRDQPPDLFKERGAVDSTVAFGALFASYPMIGPLSSGDDLMRVDANIFESWGWLHEHGHRFERGNSYGPDEGRLWIMFSGTVEVVTNIFTCVGIVNTEAENDRCVLNNGADRIVGSDEQWYNEDNNGLGAFGKLDFFLGTINAYGYDAMTNVISRGRLSRFPLNDTERINRLWLLLSEEVQRNVKPQFDAYNLPVDEQLIYEQQMIVELANAFLRMSNFIQELSERSNSVTTSGTLVLGTEHVDRLFESSVSAQFTGPSGTITVALQENITPAFSISMWVKLEQASTGAILAASFDSTSEDPADWSLMINDVGGLTFTTSSGSVVSGAAIPLNEWVQVGLSTDGSSVTFFMNGAAVGIFETGAIAGDVPFIVINADNLIIGFVAEFAQFNKAVDENRMFALFSPSPFSFPLFIEPAFLPEVNAACPEFILPEGISACNTLDGVTGDPSDCDLCMAFLCEEGPEPADVDCGPVCPSGTVVTALNGCDSCDSTCASCSEAGSAEACLSCDIESSLPLLQVTSCVAECDEDRVAVASVCVECHSTCATCSGVSDSECLTCNGLLFEFGTCVDECTGVNVLLDDTCIAECPLNMFDNSGVCTDCDSRCETCEGAADTCLTCDMAGGFPFLSGSACLSACPAGEFAMDGTFQCLSCADNCLSCEDAMDTCTSCDETGETPFFFEFDCISECPAYTTTNAFTCEGCDVSGPMPFDNDGDCVAECAFASFQFNCVDACPASHFVNGEKVCTPCDGNCLACEGSAVECTDCDTAGPTPFLSDGVCVNVCPPSFYADEVDTCQSCHSTCLECNGSENTDCSSCDVAAPLFQALADGGLCLTSCPDAFFEESSECFACHDSCSSCSGAEASDCLACADVSNVILNGECVESCPSSMFVDQTSEVLTCVECSENCLTCENSADTCTSCEAQDESFVLVDNECVACDSNCLTCSGAPDVCTSCDADGDLPVLEFGECIEECDLFIFDEECIPVCPSSYFADADRVCQVCESACNECEGSATTCTVCNDSGPTPIWDSETSTCVASCAEFGRFEFEGACVNVCPSDHYANAASSSCEECSENCMRCTGSADTCIECDRLTQFDILFEGACITECPSATYEVTGSCIACHESCAECESADSDSCTACFLNFHLESGECVEDVIGPVCSETLGNMQVVEGEAEFSEESQVLVSRTALCWPGTSTADNNCVPFGSEVTGGMDVVVEMAAELRCSICTNNVVEETFSMSVTQAVTVPVQSTRELLFLASLISDDVVNEHLAILASAAAQDSDIADEVVTIAREAFLNNLGLEGINAICALQQEDLALSAMTVSTFTSFSMAGVGGSPVDDVCDLISDTEWANDVNYLPRCICDDSVANIEAPCAQLDFAPFNEVAGAICHPRECSEPSSPEPEWVWLEIVLDADFFQFGDEEAKAIVSELVNYLQLQFGISFESLFLIKLEPGSVEMTFVLDSNADLNGDVDVAEEMVNALESGALTLSSSVIRADVLTQGTGNLSSMYSTVMTTDYSTLLTTDLSTFFTTDFSTAFQTTDLSTAFVTTDFSTAFVTTDLSTAFQTTDLSTAFVTTDLSTAFVTTDLSTAFVTTDDSTADVSTEESVDSSDIFVFSSTTDDRSEVSFSFSSTDSRRTVSGAYESSPVGLQLSGDRSRSDADSSSSASALVPGFLATALAILLL